MGLPVDLPINIVQNWGEGVSGQGTIGSGGARK